MTVGPKEQTQTGQGHFDSCMCKTVGKTDIDIRKYPRAMNEDLDTGKIDDTKRKWKFLYSRVGSSLRPRRTQ